MKKITKKKKSVISVPTATKPRTKTIKTNSRKIKQSPVDYYNCLLTQAQTDWYDPTTGRKKPITACCKDCKFNAPKLNEVRKQEIGKLITSYQQVGESLKKLLKPIN